MARHQQSAVNHNKKASQNQRVSSLPLRWSAVENGSFSWASVPAVCQAAGAKRFRKLVHAWWLDGAAGHQRKGFPM